jgi:hypothetical protein
LVAARGEASVLAHYRAVRSMRWADAFELSFGQTPAAFEAAFVEFLQRPPAEQLRILPSEAGVLPEASCLD